MKRRSFILRQLVLPILLLIAGSLPLMGQETVTITDVRVGDSVKTIELQLTTADTVNFPSANDIEVEFPYNKSNHVVVQPGDSGTKAYNIIVKIPYGTFPGINSISINYKRKKVWQGTVDVPNIRPSVDNQPILVHEGVLGGFKGTSVVIHGKNFGSNLDDVYVWLGDEHRKPYGSMVNFSKATYLSSGTGAENLQEMRFYFPRLDELLVESGKDVSKFWFNRRFCIWVFAGGQPSANAVDFNLVNVNYRFYIFLITFAIFLGISIILWLIFRLRRGGKEFHFYDIILDKDTNRLSLPKVQVLVWSVMLGFGFTYYSLMDWLVNPNGVMPDFPGTLLILLGVTSGGALINNAQVKRTFSGTRAASPSIRDLVSQGSEISLTKLQLVVFSLITLALYGTYLSDDNLVFTGMPEVPTNLLLLMGISQGSTIAGHTMEAPANPAVTSNPPVTPQVNNEGGNNPVS